MNLNLKVELSKSYHNNGVHFNIKTCKKQGELMNTLNLFIRDQEQADLSEDKKKIK